MTIDFPNSPSVNDTFDVRGVTYTWNGSVWSPTFDQRGPTGTQGPRGFTGSQGTIGFTGSTGSTGFTGSVGFSGSAGARGFSGSRGNTGFIGSTGTSGFQGSQGEQGFTGSVGGGGEFNPTTVSGTTQTLDVGSFNFFDGGSITSDITLAFSNVPTEAKWTWSGNLFAEVDNISSATYNSVSFSVSQDTAPRGFTFDTSGTRMFMVGATTDNVYSYTLTTAYDISTASYDSVSFNVSSQAGTPESLKFSNDGTVMFIFGRVNEIIYQYTLSTAWNISTASYDSISFSVTSQDTSPYGIEFNDTGTKMYMVGRSTDRIYSYTLSTAWNLSTASYDSVSFSVSAQETFPHKIIFSNSGTRMYLLGRSSNTVFQYSLTTAYDISTASYDNSSFSVNSQDTGPENIETDSTGTLFYMMGSTTDNIYQYSIPSLSVPKVTLPESLTNVDSAASTVDISVSTYDSVSFSINAQDPAPEGITFKTDGTKMYLMGRSTDSIYQYTLSTAWDLSSATYDSVSFSVASQDTNMYSVRFRDDGTQMYVIGNNADSIYQYTLSTAWDLSTASYDSVSFSFSSQESIPRDFRFKPDGTQLYVTGESDRIYQYTLGTAWNISTASYDSVLFNASSQETNLEGLEFNSLGTQMFITGPSADSVFQYTLGTAWDLSTASYDSLSFSVSSQDLAPKKVVLSSNQDKFFILGSSNDTVYQYSTNIALPNPPDLFGNRAGQNSLEFYTTNGTDVTLLSVKNPNRIFE